MGKSKKSKSEVLLDDLVEQIQREMPMPEDRTRGVALDYPEAVRLINPTNSLLKGEVLSKTMMEQYPINTEEREIDQQEECIGEEDNGVHNLNKKMTHDIASLPPLPKNPCIFKVHERLRDSNHKAYTPQLVSIGPYHHGDPKLAAMEVHKKRYLNSILKCTNQVTVEPYIKAMKELEGRARDYYANPIVLNQDEFIEMMVLDGCFVIEFLRKYNLSAEEQAGDPIFQESWMGFIVFRELVVLIENQLPFFVLSKLYDMINAFPDIPFSSFMECCISSFIGNSMPISNSDNSSLHTSSPDTPRESEGSKHFLDWVHKVCAPSTGYENLMMTSDDNKICFNIPCVVELQEAGVKFRAGGVKEGGGGDGICIFDINFEGGEMTIPKIDVGTTTKIIFHNMVAYEQYTSDFEPKYFTSYTFFMHLLINSEKDVNQLCRCNIFKYKAGNDEGVARMFEALGEGRVLIHNRFYLSKLCEDVNAHCDKSWNKLMARLRRDYFYSPWASISTFAAAFLILLTGIQTVVALITLIR